MLVLKEFTIDLHEKRNEYIYLLLQSRFALATYLQDLRRKMDKTGTIVFPMERLIKIIRHLFQ